MDKQSRAVENAQEDADHAIDWILSASCSSHQKPSDWKMALIVTKTKKC